MDNEPPAEALMLVTVSTIPGKSPKGLGQQLADAVVHLPVPAAAMLALGPLPQDIQDQARLLFEKQLMAGGAAELQCYFARMWFRPGPGMPADATSVAIACRKVWEEHVRGAKRSGMTDVFCLPAADETTWMNGARTCSPDSVVRTAEDSSGLIPASG